MLSSVPLHPIQYHYDFLPSAILSRFMVKVHRFTQPGAFWRNGVVIVHEGRRALIKADPADKKIFIEIAGGSNKRSTLSYIRSEFAKIHHSMARISVNEMVVFDEEGKVCRPYQELVDMEEMGDTTVTIPQLRRRFNIREVLNGIESPQKNISELIKRGELREALEILDQQYGGSNDEISLLLGRLSKCESGKIKGTLTRDESERMEAQIADGVFTLLRESRYLRD